MPWRWRRVAELLAGIRLGLCRLRSCDLSVLSLRLLVALRFRGWIVHRSGLGRSAGARRERRTANAIAGARVPPGATRKAHGGRAEHQHTREFPHPLPLSDARLERESAFDCFRTSWHITHRLVRLLDQVKP